MQNNKRYWLRGGVISVVIIGILMTFNTFLSQLMLYKVGLTGWFILHFLVYWPKELLSLFIPVQYGTIQTMIGTPTDGYTLSTVIIGWFILGSILGWIYGKIVNRNRV